MNDLLLLVLHGGQITWDELLSYAVGTAAAIGIAYLISWILSRTQRGREAERAAAERASTRRGSGGGAVRRPIKASGRNGNRPETPTVNSADAKPRP